MIIIIPHYLSLLVGGLEHILFFHIFFRSIHQVRLRRLSTSPRITCAEEALAAWATGNPKKWKD